MVQQFVDTRRSHVVVVLDNASSQYEDDEQFELAVCVGPSIGERTIFDEHLCTAVVGTRILPSATRNSLLDAYSGVKCDGQDGALDRSMALIGRKARDASFTLVVTGPTTPVGTIRRVAQRLSVDVRVAAIRVGRTDLEVQRIRNVFVLDLNAIARSAPHHEHGSGPVTTTAEVFSGGSREATAVNQWMPDLADVAMVAVGGMCAMLAFGSAYGGYQYLLAGLSGIVLGMAVILLGLRFSQPLPLIFTELLAAYLVVGALLFVRTGSGGVPGPANLSAMAEVTVSGWNSLLATSPVVGNTGNLLVIPFLCGVVAASSAMVLTRKLRVAWPAVLPLVALLSVGILFGTNATPPILESGGLLGVAMLAWLAYRARAQRIQGLGNSSSLGPWRIGAVLVVSGVLGVLTAPILPGYSAHLRYVLRDHVDVPFEPTNYPSPLSAYRHYVVPASAGGLKTTNLFEVQGASAGSLLRIATLDAYNGVVMTVASGDPGSGASGDFSTVGAPVSSVPCTPACHSATITITDADYSNVWLPDEGTVRSIEFAGASSVSERGDLRYNTATDDAVLTSRLRSGDRYSMQVEVPSQPPVDQMAGMPIAQVVKPSLSNVPPAVDQQAQAYVAQAATPFAKAQALATALQQGAYSDGVSNAAPGAYPSLPGHGEFRIQQFLKDPQPVGDAEQYAVAMDLMAQSLGLPARVVLGVKLPHSGTTMVTGNDITAWVEIRFTNAGWYPFFPTPNRDAQLHVVPAPPQQSTSNQAQNPNPPSPSDSNSSVSANAQTKNAEHQGGKSTWLQVIETILKVVGVMLLVLLVLLGPLIAVVWAKARRRRRRRSAVRASDRVVGGWQELVDHACDRGSEPPRSATRRQIAPIVAPGAVALAERADLHIFGPVEPSDEEATAFWQLVDASLSEIDHSMTRWQRFKLRVNPRSLVWNHRFSIGLMITVGVAAATRTIRHSVHLLIARLRPRRTTGES